MGSLCLLPNLISGIAGVFGERVNSKTMGHKKFDLQAEAKCSETEKPTAQRLASQAEVHVLMGLASGRPDWPKLLKKNGF